MKIKVDNIDKCFSFLGVVGFWLAPVYAVAPGMMLSDAIQPGRIGVMCLLQLLVLLGCYSTLKWICTVGVKPRFVLLYFVGIALTWASGIILYSLFYGNWLYR